MNRKEAIIKLRSAGRVIGLSLGKFTFVGAGLLAMLAGPAVAAPQGASVVSGQAAISQKGAQTVIKTSDRAIINYSGFDVASNESVRFIQPGVDSHVLNRVKSDTPSQIDGSIFANGQITIVNPAGVQFGASSVVDAAGLFAAAGNISDKDFMAGRMRFTDLRGSVENHGVITASRVGLVGKNVANFGSIVAPEGMVTMAAGDDVYLAEEGGSLLVKVSSDRGFVSDSTGVTNEGTIQAKGGQVIFGTGDMYAVAINNTGDVLAQDVLFDGSTRGEVLVSGTIDVSDTSKGGVGGTAHFLGEKVGLLGATVDASGTNGGGEVLVGGEERGLGDVQNAYITVVDEFSSINADAISKGDGGRVIVFADHASYIHGDLSVRGGSLYGDGGFVETSGLDYFEVLNAPSIGAANGNGGEWLIDPYDVTIITGTTQTGINNAPSPFIATGNSATIGVGTIETALGAGDVTISTGASGAQQGNITLSVDLDIQGLLTANNRTLTLEAANSIFLSADIVDGTPGGDELNLVLSADHDSSGGGNVLITGDLNLATGTLTSSGVNFDALGPTITAASFGLTHTGDVTIVNQATVALATSNITGDLIVSTTTGNITDTGTVTVGGDATFTTLTANDDIDLGTLAVTGAVAVNTSGATGNATLVNATALDLAASNIGGNLSATATTGNLTDSGGIIVGGDLTAVTSADDADIDLGDLSVSGAVALTTNGTTGNATVVNATALDLGASTVDGDLVATATTGNMTDSGTVTVSGTSNFTTSATDATINMGTLALTGAASFNTTGSSANVTLGSAAAMDLGASSIGGNLAVTLTNVNLTDSGAIDVGGTFTANTGDGTITLESLNVAAAANNFTLITTGGSGDVEVTNANAIELSASTSIDGTLTAVATTGDITDGGTWDVTGAVSLATAAADADINVGSAEVDSTIAFTTIGTGGDVTLVNDAAIDFNTSNIGGDLTVTATTGNITDAASQVITVGGNLAATATNNDDDINLDGLAVAGTMAFTTNTAGGNTGNVTVVNATGIDFAASTIDGTLDATATTGNIVTSGLLDVNGASAAFTTSAADATINLSDIDLAGTVAANTTGTAGNVTITNDSAVALAASDIGGNLTVTADTGTITDSGTVTVAGNASFTASTAAQAINLGTLAVTGTISATNSGAADITLVNATGVDLASISAGQNIDVTATTGNIVDSGTVTVAGNADYTTSEANATITLDSQAVTGNMVFSTTGASAHVVVTDDQAVSLGTSGIGGDLTVVTSSGNITDAGTVTVGGNAGFTTQASNDDINLGTLAVTGTVAANTTGGTGNVTLVNATALDLAASTIGGTLDATASTGNLTDSGVVNVNGAATFTTSNGNDDIVLDAVVLGDTVALNTTGGTGDATLTHATGIDLAASTVGGALNVTATTGNLTDSGAISIGGNGTFTASNAGDDIDLGTLEIDGTLVLNTAGTGNATIVNDAGVAIGASNVGGDLNVTATTGNITDTGTVTVGQTATFTTSNGNDDIDLGTLAVSGTIALNTTGGTGNATIVNGTGVNLAASVIGGNLDVTATTGNIMDSGNITVGGTSTFTTSASNGSIDLGTITSTGALAFNTSGAMGHVMLTNGGATALDTSAIGGDLTVSSQGALTDSGTLTVGGNASFTTTTNNDDINLGTLAVTGTIAADTTGSSGDVTLVNATALTFAASDIRGALNATATTGNITDDGALVVTGDGSFTTAGAGADITLDNLSLSGDLTAISLDNATITNADSTRIADATDVDGNFVLTVTNGNITDVGGGFEVNGDATFTTLGNNNDITLSAAEADGTVVLNTVGTGGNVSFTNDAAIVLGASNVGGDMTVVASAGSITDSGLLTIGGDASFTTTNAEVNLGTLAADADISVTTGNGNITLVNATGVDVGGFTTTGNLDVTATTGNITDSGVVSVGGTSTFTTVAENAMIDLGQLQSNGAISLNTAAGGNATITNDSAVDLAASNVGGNLDVTVTSGNLTDSGTVTVGGNATLTTVNSNDDIDLGTLEVAGTIGVNTTGATGNATFVNATAVDFATSSVGGNLTATATTGTMTDSGIVTVGGDLAITTSATAQDITLDQLAVTGSITPTTSGAANVTIVNDGAVALGAWSIGGDLAVTSTSGNITDSGAWSVAGTSAFTTTSSGDDITLDQGSSTGAVSLNTIGATGNATYSQNGSVVLGESVIGGNIDITSATGTITDEGTITAGGDAAFTTSAAAQNITLDTLDIAGAFTITTTGAANVTIGNAQAVDIGGWTVGGTLDVSTTSGDITDSSAATITGNANFTTAGENDDIVIDQSAFSGTVGFNTTGDTGDATFTHATGVDLGATSVGGTLAVTATTGNIIDSGTVSALTGASFTTSATDALITLDTFGNLGAAAFNTAGTAGHVSLTGAGDLDFAASTINGNLTVNNSAGDMSDSGTVTVTGDATFNHTGAGTMTFDTLDVTGTLDFDSSTGAANLVYTQAAGDVDVAGWNIGGDATIVATAGSIIDSGAFIVGGNATFTTSAADQTVTLEELQVDGWIAANTTGSNGDVTMINDNGFVFGPSNIGGNFVGTATAGSFFGSGTNTVAGDATFNATAMDQDIFLFGLDVTGDITPNADDRVSIYNAQAMDIGGWTVNGTLIAGTFAGDLTSSSTVTVGGNAIFSTVNDRITITNLAADGVIAATTTGSNGTVTIVNDQNFFLGNTDIAGNAYFTATTGNIVDNASAEIAGNLRLQTLATDADINTNQLDVRGTIRALTTGTSADAEIWNARRLRIQSSNVGGVLKLISTGGNIVDSGTTTVGDRLVATTTRNNADVFLDGFNIAGGGFSAYTTGERGDATLFNSGGINLRRSIVGGDLTLTATTGNITDSANTSIGGLATFSAISGAGTVSVDQVNADLGLVVND